MADWVLYSRHAVFYIDGGGEGLAALDGNRRLNLIQIHDTPSDAHEHVAELAGENPGANFAIIPVFLRLPEEEEVQHEQT